MDCSGDQIIKDEFGTAGRIPYITEKRNAHIFWWGNLKERDHLEDLEADENTVIKCISNKSYGRVWAGFIWFRTGTIGWLRSALFWGITQRQMVILYRRFGTRCRPHLLGSRSPFLDLGSRNPFLTLENGTDTLPRNVGKGLPLDAAWYPSRAQISSVPQQKSLQ
jgi:hypothetical protein